MSQRVTLDHPSMSGRSRHTTSRNPLPARAQRTPIDSMMVNRAISARAQNARREPTTQPIQTSPAAAQPIGREPEQPAQEQDFEQTVQEATQRTLKSAAYDDPHTRKGGFGSWKVNSIYGMAVILFVAGMGVAVSGFVSTTKANEQIEAIGEVLDSGDEVAISRLGNALPSEENVSDYDVSQYVVAPEEPRYIKIPSIGVGTTRILNTGLTDDNEVDVPKSIYDTSWYNGSAKITDEKGAMFVVGHYVGPNEAGIFYNLEDLKKGNIIEIEQGDGTQSFFRVVELIDYSLDNVDMAKSLSPVNPDKLGLNLMTCGGGWDVGTQKYDRRTLVRTEKI